MPCFTRIEIEQLDNTALHRKARKKLGLREMGYLSEYDTRRVKIEAGVIKAIASVRKLDPTAVIRRKGNKLSVTVQS